MCAATSRKRKRKQSLDPGDPPYEHPHARMELDSHADTTALGSCCVVLQDTGKTVTVEGFGEDVGSVDDVSIITGAVAFDCADTTKTFILIYHQSLYIPSMTTHLVNQYQVRAQGIVVNDVPLSLLPTEQQTKDSHSIISEEDGLHIPLQLQGTMSGFIVRKPTEEEIHNPNPEKVVFVHMTSDKEWQPHATDYAQVEQSLRDNIDRGLNLHLKEPRELGRLQARGQDQTLQLVFDPAVDDANGYKTFKVDDDSRTLRMVHCTEVNNAVRSE